MKTGVIIQARTSSTRLPHKVLMELPYGSGITVLQQVIRRLKKSKKLDDIIIATTTDLADEKIIKISEKENVKSFKGSIDDVLERYYLAAKESELDIVVRVTSDCPCIDPEVVDLTIEEHVNAKADFTSNILSRTFPHGLDTEVLSFRTLETAHLQANQEFEREHVCPYIYRSHPASFKIVNVEAPANLKADDIRITLDTKEDYALLCLIYDHLFYKNKFFTTEDIIHLFRRKPWIKCINEKIIQKKIFDTLEEEMTEAIKVLETHGLERVKKLLDTIKLEASK